MENLIAIVIVFGLLVVPIVLGRKDWWKQSWEGVVISKYEEIEGMGESVGYFELCHNQTVQIHSEMNKRESIEIGDYIIKKSESKWIEKRAITEKEATAAALILILRLRHKMTRSRAVEVLEKIGIPNVSALIEVLKDENPMARYRATEVLSEMGEPTKDIVPALTKALNDEDGKVRLSAFKGLKK